MADPCYTVETAAEHLAVSKDYIYTLIQIGELPAIRMGKKFIITTDDMEKFKSKKKRETAEYLRKNRLGAFLPGGMKHA